MPETIVRTIVDSLHAHLSRSETKRQEKIAALKQQLVMLGARMNQPYEGKLEGKITEEFWVRKQAEHAERERSLVTTLSSPDRPITPEQVLTMERAFEIAQKAHSPYFTRSHAEGGQLLKSGLLNCATDGVNLMPTY